MTLKLKTNLKKPVKLTVFFQINLKKKIMTILVMLLLKMEVAARVVSEVLEDLVVQIFLTFLRIFLAILEVAEGALEAETLATEART